MMNTFAGEAAGSKKKMNAGDSPMTMAGVAAADGQQGKFVDSDIPGFKNPVTEKGIPDTKIYYDAATMTPYPRSEALAIAKKRDPVEAMYGNSTGTGGK